MWGVIKNLASPKRFLSLSEKLLPWLIILFVVTITFGLVGGLLLAPADYFQGDAFRIIYIHAPCAFLSLFIYAMMAIAAVVGFIWQMKMAFLVIRHSAPIGACFTFLALVTGSLWGKPMWGTWWVWDARLTSELVLLFLYIGILLFQSATTGRKTRDRAVAILTLVGFIDIPIIHYSVYWWNSLHQGATITVFAVPKIAGSMLYPLLAMITAFLAYYTLVLFIRLRYELATGLSYIEY